MSKFPIHLQALWISAFIGLSCFSGYEVKAVGDVNFEIATMLTPWGIVQDLLLDSNHYLREYFFVPTEARHSIFSNPVVLFSTCTLILASSLMIVRMRKK